MRAEPPGRKRPVRWAELGRAAWGAALLTVPATVLSTLRVPPDRRSVIVTRILGARHLAQAALSGIDPSPEVLATGVWVDCVHALTASLLAAGDRRRARAGLTDAAVAGTWAGLGYRDLRDAHATRSSHDRRRDLLARIVLPRLPFGRGLWQLAESRRHTPG